jgi:DNA polymerase I-like protein with 3'-5' exonuclease and polymerase domains/5'-3' exonuclease
MSSIVWQNLLAGKDRENGRDVPHPDAEKAAAGKTVYVNSAAYGFENFVNNLVTHLDRFDAAPRDIVMVFDGKNSKLLRQSINANYKAGRDHAAESYVEFGKLMEQIKSTLLGLGAIAVWQDGMEADDVLCYLSQNLKSPRTIISNDGDMLVLHGPDTDVYRTGAGELNTNKYGPFSHRFVTLYKALVGDPTDNIKGAVGFGPKSFIDLLCTFKEEGLEMMEDLIKTGELARLSEDVGSLKCLQRIIDSQDSVYESWQLARMYPEKVNTIRKPLQIQAGMVRQFDPQVNDQRLKKWYGIQRIVNAGNYEDAKRWALEKLLESPAIALDIEGSAPEESTEWLEAKKRGKGGEDGDDIGVDILGMDLAGLSLTFGRNCQYSLYMPVDHVEEPDMLNLDSTQVRQFVELCPTSKPMVVHNAACELSVLFQEWGVAWKDNGSHGFLQNVYDTMIMKSYVNENTSRALKSCSKEILGYDQMTYEEVTQGRKMNQMTARETVAYGNDDTICTAALFNYFTFVMELEGSTDIYEIVERKPAYLNALRFVQGTKISMEKMFELEKEDAAAHEKAWTFVRDFLIRNGWAGTVCPQFTDTASFTAKAIKEAYTICTGEELDTQVRTPAKLFKLIYEADNTPLGTGQLLSGLLARGFEMGDCVELNKLLQVCFKGEPQFKADSPTNMKTLLYTTLALPVRLRNKPTEIMRKAGIREGGAKADDFALEFAIKFDADRGEEVLNVLKSIQTMRVMDTRRKLYYVPYRNMRHWKDNLVHSSLNQCATVTRRYSESDPNKGQLGKNVKHGHKPRIREVYVPHHKRAVIVSMDFSGQELRGIAEQSQDPNMLACFMPPPGEKKKDLHSMTAGNILRKKPLVELVRMLGIKNAEDHRLPDGALWDAAAAYARWKGCSYEEFERALADKTHPDYVLCGELRQIGKKVNFTTEYGAQALKVSETLIITPEEAQVYIDAKEAAFPVATQWKKDVIALTNRLGYSTTMMGARRHLAEALMSSNRLEASKAERQAVNFKVQGSAAEQTKSAEARFWDGDIFFDYDARYIGPVHDETVSSVAVDDLIPWLKKAHAMMTANYAGMKVPVVSEISIGPNYGQLIKIGETVDEKKINEALQSLGFEVAVTA